MNQSDFILLRSLSGDIPEGDIKIFGSAVTCSEDDIYNDIDIAVNRENTDAVTAVLRMKEVFHKEIHPLLLSKMEISMLHNLLSWSCDAVTLDIHSAATIYTTSGDNRTHKKAITRFNPNSVMYGTFNRHEDLMQSYKKKLKQGYNIPDAELNRAEFFVTGDTNHIVKTLYSGNVIGTPLLSMLISPDTTIAGGVFRDLITGRSVKDIDVFVTTKEAYVAIVNLLRSSNHCKELIVEKKENNNAPKPVPLFKKSPMSITKFVCNSTNVVVDIIHYDIDVGNQKPTVLFDFAVNMLSMNSDGRLEGNELFSADVIIDSILNKRLFPSPNAWIIGNPKRLLNRIGRFMAEGYTVPQSSIGTLKRVLNNMTNVKVSS